jgi:hypothetical protein
LEQVQQVSLFYFHIYGYKIHLLYSPSFTLSLCHQPPTGISHPKTYFSSCPSFSFFFLKYILIVQGDILPWHFRPKYIVLQSNYAPALLPPYSLIFYHHASLC